MKTALIIGAGPAGLTAAYELLKQSDEIKVIVLEESECCGGISKTVAYKGNRMDMGGHRFFSKMESVNEWWEKVLPAQGAPALDDIILQRSVPISPNGPDPQKEDRVFLNRRRVSRILFDGKFYDYPISLKWETLTNMGIVKTIEVGFSYLNSLIHKLPENSLENFYINRFGKKLYSMFFEYYTENLWGRHPREIDPSWGAQRVKGLSITALLKNIFEKIIGKKDRKIETSLIEEFKYPKYGPGQLWDETAKEIINSGGEIIFNAQVLKLRKDHNRLTGLTYLKDGCEYELGGDFIISSMPLKDLVGGMNDVPQKIADIAAGLPYRDYITMGVLVPELKLKNQTKIKTLANIIPDCWIYVQDRHVKMGRIQIFNNWSPYMVRDPEHTVWIGLEYFANEGDELWQMDEKSFTDLGIREMKQLGIIDSESVVMETHIEKIKKAYPAYFDTYNEIDTLIEWLNTIENLYCVGRNGQHRYNNMDHSMATSFEAVRNILSGRSDKSNIWNVNTEKEYHESKQSPVRCVR